jgi:uncharacterized Zn-binding protein involved in type VI secretion
MPGVARKNTDAAGGVAIEGSENVFVNGFGVVRIGDDIAAHSVFLHLTPVMAEGSTNVFVNGIGVCRAGDSATCGHIISGSDNVSVN